MITQHIRKRFVTATNYSIFSKNNTDRSSFKGQQSKIAHLVLMPYLYGIDLLFIPTDSQAMDDTRVTDELLDLLLADLTDRRDDLIELTQNGIVTLTRR